MAQYYESGHRSFLVDAAYSRGTRVKLSATANTVTVATASDVEVGVLTAASFANGDTVDVLLRSAQGTFPAVASGAITVNSLVYPDASGKVTATADGLPIGMALVAASADKDIIEVLRMPVASGKLFTQVAASTAVANTTTETLFSQSFSIPANFLKAGDRLRIRAQGIATATNSTDTLNAKLYIGGLAGTAICATGALDVANNDIFYIDVDLVVRTAGATGTIVAAGVTNIGTPGTATVRAANLASTTLDTTAAQVIGVSATWSVANAGDSCRLDILDIERLAA